MKGRGATLAALAIGFVLTACGSGGSVATTHSPSPGITPSHSGSTPSNVASTPSSVASPTLPAGFVCADSSGGSNTTGSAVTAVRTGAHPEGAYDRFTIEFDGTIPDYTVTRQSGATFTRSPKGDQVTLAGNHGVLVRVQPVTNWTSYSGPTSFGVTGQYLRQAMLLENNEAVFQWGLGIQGNPCLHVFTLTGPSRLVIDVTAQP
jgi:hypothetical protein